MAGNGFQIEWCRVGGWIRVRTVIRGLIAKRCNGEQMPGRTDPGTDPVAVHFLESRRSVRVAAIKIVVSRANER